MILTKEKYKYIHRSELFYCSPECVRRVLSEFHGSSTGNKYRRVSEQEMKNKVDDNSTWCPKRRQFFRSDYEILVADWLDLIGIKYEYETIILSSGKQHYLPDFYIPESDTFLEVKGLWRMGAKAKIQRIREAIPGIRLIVITFLLKPQIERIVYA